VYSDTFLAGYAVLAGERQAGFGTLKRGAMAGIVRENTKFVTGMILVLYILIQQLIQ